MDPAPSKAEQENGYFTARMKENFLYSAERLLPAQMGQYSVGFKNDPVCGFLTKAVSVRNSPNGLKAQNAQKLHNLAAAFTTQNTSIDATRKDMSEFTVEELESAMQELKRGEQDDERIKAIEKATLQELNQESERKDMKIAVLKNEIAAIEKAFQKHRDAKLADVKAEKASIKERIDDATRNLFQKTLKGKLL